MIKMTNQIINIPFGKEWVYNYSIDNETNLRLTEDILKKKICKWDKEKIVDILAKYIYLSKTFPLAKDLRENDFSKVYFASKRITKYSQALEMSWEKVLHHIKDNSFEYKVNHEILCDHMEFIMNTKRYNLSPILLAEFILFSQKYPTFSILKEYKFKKFYKFISDRSPLSFDKIAKSSLNKIIDWSSDHNIYFKDIKKFEENAITDFTILLKNCKKNNKKSLLNLLLFLFENGNSGYYKLKKSGFFVNHEILKSFNILGFIETTYSGSKITKKGAKILLFYKLIKPKMLKSPFWELREELQYIASKKQNLGYNELLNFLSFFEVPTSVRKISKKLNLSYEIFKNYTYKEIEKTGYLKRYTPYKVILTKKGKITLNSLKDKEKPITHNITNLVNIKVGPMNLKNRKSPYHEFGFIKSLYLHKVINSLFKKFFDDYVTVYLEKPKSSKNTGIFDVVMVEKKDWNKLNNQERNEILKYINQRGAFNKYGKRFDLNYIAIDIKACNKSRYSLRKYEREQLITSIIKLSKLIGLPSKVYFITTGILPEHLDSFSNNIIKFLNKKGYTLHEDNFVYLKLSSNPKDIKIFPINNNLLFNIKGSIEKNEYLKNNIAISEANIVHNILGVKHVSHAFT